MSPTIRCYACQIDFSLDPDQLHPYQDGLIQGQRAPRYWIRCPVCGQKNVIQLGGGSGVIAGKPTTR
jgi:hypothetical protein